MADRTFAVVMEARSGDLITTVLQRARDLHDDAVADAVAELFEALEGRLLERREGVYPFTLALTPLALQVLTRTIYALERWPDIGRATVLLLVRRETAGLGRREERAA